MALKVEMLEPIVNVRALPGEIKQQRLRITFDNAYTIGGESFTPAMLNPDWTTFTGFDPESYAVSTWTVFYQNLVLVAWADGAVGADDLSTLIVEGTVYGN